MHVKFEKKECVEVGFRVHTVRLRVFGSCAPVWAVMSLGGFTLGGWRGGVDGYAKVVRMSDFGVRESRRGSLKFRLWTVSQMWTFWGP